MFAIAPTLEGGLIKVEIGTGLYDSIVRINEAKTKK